MNLICKVVLACFFTLTFSCSGYAAERGTPDEAVAMVKKGIAYIKANGRDKAYAEISNLKGQFVDRDLYLMVYDLQGNNKAHGANPKLPGKNLMEIMDADGKQIVKAFVETASGKGSGWIDYRWPNPLTKAIEPKSTYVERYEDILVGCGVYK